MFCAATVSRSFRERNVHVFAGPSVAPGDCGIPVQFHSPIARGDLEKLTQEAEPDRTAVVIVDGHFGSRLSVPVMECRQAIERGFILVGMSSIGALRAADLWPAGMLGYGDIFLWYRSGLLLDESEVAVLYNGDCTQELTVSGVRCRAVVAGIGTCTGARPQALSDAASRLLSVPWAERTADLVVDLLATALPGTDPILIKQLLDRNPKRGDATRFFSALDAAWWWPGHP